MKRGPGNFHSEAIHIRLLSHTAVARAYSNITAGNSRTLSAHAAIDFHKHHIE